MSSTTDPRWVDPSAAARLADRKWRWKNSIWVFAPALCLGFVSCAGFIYAANKVHNRKWTVYAVISTVVTLAVCLCAFIFETDDHKVADWAINLVLVSWILHLIAGISLRNNYLRLLAQRQAQDELAPFGIPPLAPAPTYPPPPTPAAPAPVQGLVGMNDFYAPTPAQLDINSASAAELSATTGLGPAQADAVIAARTRVGGFRSFEEIAASAGLAPHHLARLREVSFGPSQPDPGSAPHNPPPPPPVPGGRILDI
ncbi:hypothetical protein GII30_01040 [Gordonia amarae]|uniref:DNA-binding protein n=2 Tax=Gordonia amarae TaxID=36821 RepID=G7GUU1_9ACTN|nr:helix-hairpin-helix domain-containing protein [Gordonia amarae]MCS3876928.1 hypothetical protein [Gordonia amarae]QHN15755.1 hypothetical protein GII35_01040 [Gordonia amarae]QHN20324.1 hypothetical protein GII34_01040 [Gordonia amarae]QHN29175.1 hypothetical protein GII32_01045 [Gordonia amarae]QHN37954.1 hypothetical protein GII30_01040 [Gordonia amarae]